MTADDTQTMRNALRHSRAIFHPEHVEKLFGKRGPSASHPVARDVAVAEIHADYEDIRARVRALSDQIRSASNLSGADVKRMIDDLLRELSEGRVESIRVGSDGKFKTLTFEYAGDLGPSQA